jgi:sortase A
MGHHDEVTSRKVVSLALCAIGIGLLAWWASAQVGARLEQDRLARRLAVTDSASTSAVPESALATRREAGTSGLVGRFEIPRLGLSAMITEGVDDDALGRGIGHAPKTPFPGERGNVGLAAHRDTYFRKLKDIARGDRVQVTTPDGVFAYEVEWTKIVDPHRVDLLDPTAAPSLTLVTCYPFYWIGHAPKRFVVRCLRVGGDPSAAAPAPRPLAAAAGAH